MPITFGATPGDQWIYDPVGPITFDVSRGADAKASRVLSTQKGDIRFDPAKSAIIVIDMQNFFLHPAIRPHPTGLAAVDVLADKVIPASRGHGIKIIYVNWGLTDEEVAGMPPCHAASFGASTVRAGREFEGGFGSPMGEIAGTNVADAGGLLMRGAWNSDLYGKLQPMYEEGLKAGTDAWVHKNRMSAMWGTSTLLETYLAEHGIKTLFYSGVNSDQCVLGTLLDAHNKGFDSIFLTDCAGTANFEGREEFSRFEAGVVGFLSDSENFLAGLNA